MWTPTQDDAVLVVVLSPEGDRRASSGGWGLPGDWKPGQRAKEDHAMAQALAGEGAAWEPTSWFDQEVLCGADPGELANQTAY